MISVTDNGAVRSLLLDRPEALNAFNNRMFDQLADALLLAADDDSVKVVVITGAGGGIGSEIVALFSSLGGKVVAVDIAADALNSAVERATKEGYNAIDIEAMLATTPM